MPPADALTDWAVFGGSILIALGIDRLLCRRNSDQVSWREALSRSVLWITIGIGFTLWVWSNRGPKPAVSYLTAYLVEESLSVDNLFVFLMIFRYFGLNDRARQRVLKLGILGAIVLRALFVLTGAALLRRFEWVAYVFGALLVASGIKLIRSRRSHDDPGQNPVLRLARKYLRTTTEYDGHQWFRRIKGTLYATPLFLVLLVVELTDMVFAIDSVPAVLAISDDLFVVYTSNIMAVLGLRALFFLLAGMIDRFHRLDLALAAILIFVGVKISFREVLPLSSGVSLALVAGLLTLGVVASLLSPVKGGEPSPPSPSSPPPPEPPFG